MRHFVRMGFLLGKLLLTTGCVTIMQLDWVLEPGAESASKPLPDKSLIPLGSSEDSHGVPASKRQSTTRADCRFGSAWEGSRATGPVDAAYTGSPGPASRYDTPGTREGVPPSPSRSASCRGSRPPETS